MTQHPLTRRLGETLFRYRGELSLLAGAVALVFARPDRLSITMGVACVVLGELSRLLALRHIGRQSRTSKAPEAVHLVRSGPYAWTRNPLYLANMLLVLGGLLALSRWEVLAVLGPAVACAYALIIPIEERALLASFGEAYRQYIGEVPRLLPRPPRRRDTTADLEPPLGWLEVVRFELSTIVAIELGCSAILTLAIVRG